MIRSSQSDSTSSAAEARNMECWAKDAQAQVLRVELGDGSCFFFPYVHLLFASLETKEAVEMLLLSFTTHEVRVSGRSLRPLALAAQKLAVDWIRELPPRYEGLAVPDGAFITKIEVKEAAQESE